MQNLRKQVTIWPQKGEQASGILELLVSYRHCPTKEIEVWNSNLVEHGLYVRHYCDSVFLEHC